MKKRVPFFVFLILVSSYSFAYFSISNLDSKIKNKEQVLGNVPNYKKETAKKVFNKLKRSLGYIDSEKPHLSLVKALPDDGFRMAMIDFQNGVIYLEEAAYDICKTFGKDSLNAMAVYLGHELAHLIGKHDVVNHFTWVYAYEKVQEDATLLKLIERTLPSESTKDSLINQRQKKRLIEHIQQNLRYYTITENEKDADLSGGFIAYLSGFKTFGIAPRLLDKTYNNFNLPKVSKKYPSLEERKQIAATSDEKLKDLIEFFEMGNLLVALSEYDEAIFYYNKVLKQFKSREIYNNIGVLYTLSFLEKADKKRVKFAFPVELDANSRLNNPGTKGNEENELKKLHHAIKNFEKAGSMDDDYPIPHLNKSCAHTLLGIHAKDPDLVAEEFAFATAEALITKRLTKKNLNDWKKTLTDSYTQNGIIEALKGNKNKANLLFKEAFALAPKNHLATINYNILNEIEEVQVFGFNPPGSFKKEIIDNIPIERIKVTANEFKDVVFQSNGDTVKFFIKHLDHSKLMINHVDEKGKIRYSSVQLSDADYQGATAEGIKRNDDITAIKEKYGEPSSYFELGQGRWLIYNNAKIIFQLDINGKLVRWSIFNQVN